MSLVSCVSFCGFEFPPILKKRKSRVLSSGKMKHRRVLAFEPVIVGFFLLLQGKTGFFHSFEIISISWATWILWGPSTLVKNSFLRTPSGQKRFEENSSALCLQILWFAYLYLFSNCLPQIFCMIYRGFYSLVKYAQFAVYFWFCK